MTKPPRKIVAVRKDDNGDITHVKFRGSAAVTPLSSAIKLAEQGGIANCHVVHGGTKDYLRSNPDRSRQNNLDDLPEV